MNKTDKGSKPQRRWRSVILDTLNRGTARFYAILGISFPGRIMTGYRRAESRLFGSDRYTGQNRCGPRSAARRRLVEAAEASRVCRWIEWILRAMLDGPTACYGLFFGSCGFEFTNLAVDVLFIFIGTASCIPVYLAHKILRVKEKVKRVKMFR